MARRPPLHVAVLAAGRGVRMASERPKVLHELGGQSMLARVVSEARKLRPARITVVVGPESGAVRAALAGSGVSFAVQKKPDGTAAAALAGVARVPASATVLILFGDLPLLQASSLRKLARAADSGKLAVRTMRPANPHGYSRLLRDAEGRPRGLVVEKMASAAQRRITEVDAGGMAFPARWGKAGLQKICAPRSRRERLLTDLVAMACAEALEVAPVEVDASEGLGVNTKAELMAAEAALSRRQVAELAGRGVLFADPASVSVRGAVKASPGAFVDGNVVLAGAVTLGPSSCVRSFSVVKDSKLAEGAVIESFTHADGAVLKKGAQAGPYARLRPGTVLGERSKVGNFVEAKKLELGAGAKANHLSYLGDATVAADVNVGAGTVFCNYDGVAKHRTTVGAGAFVGSGSMLIAPVEIGEGAVVAAGSVITKNVAAGETAFGRARQINTRRKRRRR